MKIYLVIALVAAAIGATVAKMYFPTERTVTETVETVRNNIVTEVREVVRPDGSKEIVTVIKDNSTKKSTDTATVVAAPKPKWHASISATRSAEDALSRSANMIYGAQVTYAILGPFSAGVRVDSSKQIGFVLGMSF